MEIQSGSRQNSSEPAKGGLGGYSTGLLSLTKANKLFIYVGGEGKSAKSEDGCITNGGFPDGGGTKTGLKENYTSAPGTGGGSTSIRISSDSLYSRIIVTGGGGGGSGDSYAFNQMINQKNNKISQIKQILARIIVFLVINLERKNQMLLLIIA